MRFCYNLIKSGNNPAVASMHNKRLVIYREPDSEEKKLCGSAIKELGREVAKSRHG